MKKFDFIGREAGHHQASYLNVILSSDYQLVAVKNYTEVDIKFLSKTKLEFIIVQCDCLAYAIFLLLRI